MGVYEIKEVGRGRRQEIEGKSNRSILKVKESAVLLKKSLKSIRIKLLKRKDSRKRNKIACRRNRVTDNGCSGEERKKTREVVEGLSV